MAGILVVDDEESVRTLMDRLLSEKGHDVVAVADGNEALTVMAGVTFDVLICDLFMPKMDGIELIQQLRDSNPDQKIIAMSGGAVNPNRGNDFLKMSKLLGAQVTLAKPFDAEMLADAVDEALAS